MRPHPDKCGRCDFRSICSKTPEDFRCLSLRCRLKSICLGGTETARAFSLFQAK